MFLAAAPAVAAGPLYDHAELSFAVANAHPRITATARYRAPANTEDGVLRTIAELLTRQG